MNVLKAATAAELNTALVMFKAQTNELHKNLQILFNLYDPLTSCATRQQSKFIHRYSRTNSKSMCMSVKGVKLWNSMDHILTNCGIVKKNGIVKQTLHC